MIDIAIVTLGASTAVIYVVLGPTLIQGATDLWQEAFSVAYPVGDVVLIFGLASLLLRGSAPSARQALYLLAAGLVFYVAADLVYGYITLTSTYQGGDPVDTLWMIAIALMAIAGAAQRGVDGPEQIAAARERPSWVPYVAVGFVFAVLLAETRAESFFPGTAIGLAAVMAAGLVSARQYLAQRDLVRAQGRLRHEALHDALTGLPNRLLVHDRAEQGLARAYRTHAPPAVLFLDVDRFKRINDTFGHAAGDELLCVVAERLRSVVRANDTVGRMGGDEFVILLDQSTTDVAPELVAERVLEVLHHPITLHGASERTLTITASLGIAVGPYERAEQMLRDADVALYRAKEAGRDRYVTFESDMHAAVEARLRLEMDLRDAIAGEQLFLMYQPIVDLHSEDLTGVEALLRWRHPTAGVIAPEEFIPLAEESGMIIPIGGWVLREACRQGAHWHAQGLGAWIAVNVSPYQLDADGFVSDVAQALTESGLPASWLMLEITETALMRDPERVADTLGAVKELGVRVAIDDFGTGYSSLSYLRQFPVDALKIDRSFTSSMANSREATALIHTLVQLGKSLGLETIAEGIEQESQLRQLQHEDCDLGQGFLLARPLAREAVQPRVQATPQAGGDESAAPLRKARV